MYPTNNIYLGSPDTAQFLNGSDNLDTQLRQLELYKLRLQELLKNQPKELKVSLWQALEAEFASLTDEQKSRLNSTEEYILSYTQLRLIIENEVFNLVKGKIEASEEGRQLLEKHLALTKELKASIVQDALKEMELFLKFKEYAKNNPNSTYEEFLKANI